MSGENHPNWEGGITEFNKELRNFVRLIGWSRKVFKRDNYICQECNKRGGKLAAHHKIPLNDIKIRYNVVNIEIAEKCDILYDITNGITMCEECHKSYHKKIKEENYGYE